MSYVRIWVHLVFTTKDREANLTKDIRDKLINHIRTNSRVKDIYLDTIGGWTEHLHLLISLGRDQAIAKIAMLLKGESAHWFNQQKFVRGKFSLQDDYFALSVSESLVDRVRNYIENQEFHHQAKPFADEFEFLRKLADGQLG